MPYFFLLISLFFFSSINYAQSDIVESGESYISAIVNRDFEKVIAMTPNHLVEIGGGPELMIKDLYKERQSMVDSGMDYIKGTLGKPGEMIETENEIQTIIPVTYQLVMNKKEVEQLSHFLAIKKNSEDNWTFLDLVKYDKESLKTFLPSLSDKIKFP